MGYKLIDILYQRFGRLVVTKRAKHPTKLSSWECKCDCGNTCIVSSGELRKGQTKSCGCLRKEVSAWYKEEAQ